MPDLYLLHDQRRVNYKASTGENYSAKFDGRTIPSTAIGTTAVVLKKIDDQTFQETTSAMAR